MLRPIAGTVYEVETSRQVSYIPTSSQGHFRHCDMVENARVRCWIRRPKPDPIQATDGISAWTGHQWSISTHSAHWNSTGWSRDEQHKSVWGMYILQEPVFFQLIAETLMKTSLETAMVHEQCTRFAFFIFWPSRGRHGQTGGNREKHKWWKL